MNINLDHLLPEDITDREIYLLVTFLTEINTALENRYFYNLRRFYNQKKYDIAEQFNTDGDPF